MAPGNIRLYLNTTFNLPIAYLLFSHVRLFSPSSHCKCSCSQLTRGVKVKWSEILIQFMAGYYFSTSTIKASKPCVEHDKRKAIMKCHHLSFTLCVDSVDHNDQVKKTKLPFRWTFCQDTFLSGLISDPVSGWVALYVVRRKWVWIALTGVHPVLFQLRRTCWLSAAPALAWSTLVTPGRQSCTMGPWLASLIVSG